MGIITQKPYLSPKHINSIPIFNMPNQETQNWDGEASPTLSTEADVVAAVNAIELGADQRVGEAARTRLRRSEDPGHKKSSKSRLAKSQQGDKEYVKSPLGQKVWNHDDPESPEQPESEPDLEEWDYDPESSTAAAWPVGLGFAASAPSHTSMLAAPEAPLRPPPGFEARFTGRDHRGGNKTTEEMCREYLNRSKSSALSLIEEEPENTQEDRGRSRSK